MYSVHCRLRCWLYYYCWFLLLLPCLQLLIQLLLWCVRSLYVLWFTISCLILFFAFALTPLSNAHICMYHKCRCVYVHANAILDFLVSQLALTCRGVQCHRWNLPSIKKLLTFNTASYAASVVTLLWWQQVATLTHH